MYQLTLSDLKTSVAKMKSALEAGDLSIQNCSTMHRRILELNKDIDDCKVKDDFYLGLVECCYNYYRMIEDFYH